MQCQDTDASCIKQITEKKTLILDAVHHLAPSLTFWGHLLFCSLQCTGFAHSYFVKCWCSVSVTKNCDLLLLLFGCLQSILRCFSFRDLKFLVSGWLTASLNLTLISYTEKKKNYKVQHWLFLQPLQPWVFRFASTLEKAYRVWKEYVRCKGAGIVKIYATVWPFSLYLYSPWWLLEFVVFSNQKYNLRLALPPRCWGITSIIIIINSLFLSSALL